MGIVDLRGREREPEVLRLIEPEPSWVVVGWGREGGLEACAGLERTSPDELAIRALASDDGRAAVALLTEIARVATGSLLVADVEAADSHPYRNAGFQVEAAQAGRVRCVRALGEEVAADASVRAMSLHDVECAIRGAWSRDTSDDPDEWSDENPARGQCAVTALLVRELLGGEIVVASVIRDGRRTERHAWNRLPSGIALDLTREQFVGGERLGEASVEEPQLTERHPERYEKLRTRVRAALELG